jgi:hypothetical protein
MMTSSNVLQVIVVASLFVLVVLAVVLAVQPPHGRKASHLTDPAKPESQKKVAETVTSRDELAEVLRAAKTLLARPGNDYSWSSWQDADAATRELDGLIQAVESGTLPARPDIAVLFLPTGPIQEVSLSSGWGDEFLTLATKFDDVAKRVYAATNRDLAAPP